MDLQDMLAGLRQLAKKDPTVRDRLLVTRDMENGEEAFCGIASELGFEMGITELAFAGENDYAHMRRATNSPVLRGEDDYYDLFMCELEAMKLANR